MLYCFFCKGGIYIYTLTFFSGVLINLIVNCFVNEKLPKKSFIFSKNNLKQRLIIDIFVFFIFLTLYVYVRDIGIYFKYYMLISFLIATAIIDFKKKCVYSFFSLIFFIISIFETNIINCIAAVLIYVIFFIVIKVAKIIKGIEIIGMGDIDIIALVILYLPINSVYTFIFYTFVSFIIFSTFMIATRKIKSKDIVPLCPFITIGAIITIFIS